MTKSRTSTGVRTTRRARRRQAHLARATSRPTIARAPYEVLVGRSGDVHTRRTREDGPRSVAENVSSWLGRARVTL